MTMAYPKRLDMLCAALGEAPYVQPFKPDGAFYLLARIQLEWPGYDGNWDYWSMTNQLIDEAGIGSSPGSALGAGGAGQIRVASSCSSDHVEEAAQLWPSTLRVVTAP
jgi:aspartate aminotransferase